MFVFYFKKGQKFKSGVHIGEIISFEDHLGSSQPNCATKLEDIENVLET